VNEEQMEAMLNYVEQSTDCRQVLICSYFGEKKVVPCGKCDICLENRRKLEQDANFSQAKKELLEKTDNDWIKVDDLLPQNAHFCRCFIQRGDSFFAG
jgi:ATP-dependent DNA helicase RecQ